ncbi:MAG TPA: helix-turn-helix domain-containing protein [Pyrinomonadaceae bacterium]|jgi:hypothetical protein
MTFTDGRHDEDPGDFAQADEARARAPGAGGLRGEAERVNGGVAETCGAGGEAALLADALTARGVEWAGAGAFEESIAVLRRAMRLAQEAGANAQAARAALTLIEEHAPSGRLAESEAAEVYRRAEDLLKGTRDAGDVARLRACARLVIRLLSGLGLHDEGFSFYGEVQRLEERLIGRALESEAGDVSRAARRLGLKHQSLSHMLNSRHRRLLAKRKPPGCGRRGVVGKRR